MVKLLIVDDDEHQRRLYETVLKKDGYGIVLAENGKQALELVDTENPDLIVMDIRMPVMDGIEAMGRVLSRDNQIPVILHTAYSGYKDNFLSWNADAYVVKSSDLTDLCATIKKVLEKRGVDQSPEA